MQLFHLKKLEKSNRDIGNRTLRLKPQSGRLNLEWAGFWHCLRRLVQAFRKTLRTWADLAQILEGINAALMTVAPAEIEGVIAHRRYAHPLDA
jgi:hypothetical protein